MFCFGPKGQNKSLNKGPLFFGKYREKTVFPPPSPEREHIGLCVCLRRLGGVRLMSFGRKKGELTVGAQVESIPTTKLFCCPAGASEFSVCFLTRSIKGKSHSLSLCGPTEAGEEERRRGAAG